MIHYLTSLSDAQMFLTTPRIWMPNYVQKFNLISQLVYEITEFKESHILIGLEVLDHNSKIRFFPES